MLAHRLKGAAGSYGFPEITKQAGQLERAVRQGEGVEILTTELDSLETLCARARNG
jgi:HPt (histidine-containing phosphotransfer) domain-containing protein